MVLVFMTGIAEAKDRATDEEGGRDCYEQRHAHDVTTLLPHAGKRF